jgi:hypothetical protein
MKFLGGNHEEGVVRFPRTILTIGGYMEQTRAPLAILVAALKVVTQTRNNCPGSIISFQRLSFHVHDEISQPYQLFVRVIQVMIHQANFQIQLPNF